MTHILPGYIYSWMAENKSILAVPINGGFFSRCGDDHLIIPEESKSLVGYKCFLFVFRSFNTFFVFLPWKPTEKQRAINHSLVFSPCISATSQGNGLRPVARCRSPGKNNRSETWGSDLKPSNSWGPGSSPGASAPKSFGGCSFQIRFLLIARKCQTFSMEFILKLGLVWCFATFFLRLRMRLPGI